MKRRLLLLIGLLAAAALAYGGSHWWLMKLAADKTPPSADPLGWIQQEFQLDDAVFVRVKALHKAYEPKCAEMCMKIARANGRVQTLTEQSAGMTPELAQAVRDAHLSHAECQTALLTHIYETAALMPQEAAQRYLKAVTARVTSRDGQCIAVIMEEDP